MDDQAAEAIEELIEESEAIAAVGISNMSDEEKDRYNNIVCELKFLDDKNEQAYEYI